MHSLFLALVLFPQVQRRAQAELDAVIGRDQLPTFDDRPRLPYIEALCKELLRWQMVTPIGTSYSLHRVDHDDNSFQVFPIHQVGIVFTKDSSSRKVGLYIRLFRPSRLTIWFKRIHNGS